MAQNVNDDQPPIGRRFTHVYFERGAPMKDSDRFRGRFAQALVDEIYQTERTNFARYMSRELGVTVPANIYEQAQFFQKCALHNLLDCITIAGQYLIALPRVRTIGERHGRPREDALRTFVERALAEENLGYRIDHAFGIHPTVDVVFEAERVSVIQALTGKRYTATLGAFEDAHKALEADPPNLKGAIQLTFESVENLFKLICQGAPRLAKDEINSRLLPIIEKRYPENTARLATNKLAAALVDWVDGAHFYRHSPGVEDPVDPPVEFSVMMMSTGAGFLRWLAELDRALKP